MKLPLSLRPFSDDDLPFILSSTVKGHLAWLKQHVLHTKRLYGGSLYASAHSLLIQSMLYSPFCTVAIVCHEDDPSQVYGWTIVLNVNSFSEGPERPVICAIYVKQAFLEFGVLHWLWELLGKPTEYVCPNSTTTLLSKDYNLKWRAFWASKFQGGNIDESV